jgi:hypothetical protein
MGACSRLARLLLLLERLSRPEAQRARAQMSQSAMRRQDASTARHRQGGVKGWMGGRVRLRWPG